MKPALRKLLKLTANYRRLESINAHGDEVYAAAVSFPCYIELKEVVIPGLDGGSRLMVKTLIITETELRYDDLVYLPGRDTSTNAYGRNPDQILTYYDPQSSVPVVDHYEVLL